MLGSESLAVFSVGFACVCMHMYDDFSGLFCIGISFCLGGEIPLSATAPA